MSFRYHTKKQPDSWAPEEVSQKAAFRKSLELHNEVDELYKFKLNNFLYYNCLMKIVPYTLKSVLWYQGESNAVRGEAENYCEMFAELVFDHTEGMWLDCDWFIDTYIYDSEDIHYQINGRTATATIEDNKLYISWTNGINPVGIKMGYWNAPTHKLKNKSGYLASPVDVRF